MRTTVILASRQPAVRRAGLVLTEATAVLPEGRVSPQDLGIWMDVASSEPEETEFGMGSDKVRFSLTIE